MRHIFALFILFSLAAVSAEAQQQMIDVVYLHDGSIIRGMIIEQIPNESLKIQTRDGSVFVYEMAEVQRLTRESAQLQPAWAPNGNRTVTPDLQQGTGPAQPVTQPVPGTSRKAPGTATALAFLVTGAGHIYAGEGGTGFILLITGAAAPYIGASLSNCNDSYNGYYYDSSCDYTPLYIGIGVSAFTWLYSLVDAGRAAKRTNRENRWDQNYRAELVPTVLRDPARGNLHAGLAMRLSF